jgi:hypothetical protein
VMFDVFFLPCQDCAGRSICVLACDHFTKYQWGCVLSSKSASGVVDFLEGISNAEGNAERWHCDNGREFKNEYVWKLQELLNVRAMTHGKPLHPQTQGLVERGNGQLKKRLLKMGLELGHKHAHATFDWSAVLDEELMKENDAPKALYKGLTAFFCLRYRVRDCHLMNPTPPELMSEIHTFMHDCQRAQGDKMVMKGNPVQYAIGDIVRVHATGTSLRLGHVFFPWASKGKIIELHPRTHFYYKIKWLTIGTKGEVSGSIAKGFFPWSCLKIYTAAVVVADDDEGEFDAQENEDLNELFDKGIEDSDDEKFEKSGNVENDNINADRSGDLGEDEAAWSAPDGDDEFFAHAPEYEEDMNVASWKKNSLVNSSPDSEDDEARQPKVHTLFLCMHTLEVLCTFNYIPYSLEYTFHFRHLCV